MSGVELIAEERKRQVESEGWTAEHDDQHSNQQLAWAAVCYAAPSEVKAKVIPPDADCGCRSVGECMHWLGEPRWGDPWPWDVDWDKRQKHDRIRQLQIAGALMAAEIDRLQRKSA